MQHGDGEGVLDPHAFQSLSLSTPIFSGIKGEDAARWLMKIERVAHALGANQSAQLAVAISKLEGAATDFSEGRNFNSWAMFKSAVLERYAEDPQVLKQRLAKCKQTAGEPVENYIDRFRVAAIRANVTAGEGEDVLNKFLKGLSSHLYDRVIATCPTTYDQAVEKAIYFSRKLHLSGRGHLLQNESDGKAVGSSSRPPNHAYPSSYGQNNNMGRGRYEPRNTYPQQGSQPPRDTRPPPLSQPRPTGEALSREFDQLKINLRQPGPHPRIMIRSSSCPRSTFGMWDSEDSADEFSPPMQEILAPGAEAPLPTEVLYDAETGYVVEGPFDPQDPRWASCNLDPSSVARCSPTVGAWAEYQQSIKTYDDVDTHITECEAEHRPSHVPTSI